MKHKDLLTLLIPILVVVIIAWYAFHNIYYQNARLHCYLKYSYPEFKLDKYKECMKYWHWY